MVAFDFAQSREYGKSRDRSIMDLARRFKYLQAEDVADLVTAGRLRVARARLLRLYQSGQLRRFALGRFEPFIYTPLHRSQKAHHALMVLRAYRALVKTLPSGWRVTSFDPEYELHTHQGKRILADALAVLDNPLASRRRVVFLEINLDPRWEKTAAYNALYESGSYERTWWYRPGVEVILAAATVHPATVERKIQQENKHGLSWVVSSVEELPTLWTLAFRAKP